MTSIISRFLRLNALLVLLLALAACASGGGGKIANTSTEPLPPPDTTSSSGAYQGASDYRIGAQDLLVTCVSRLAVDLKLDALVRAIDAIAVLASRHRVRLAIVGDGPARHALVERAQAVNERLGRDVISLLGASLDPRSAYAAADVVLGMGSSALRALSIGRPVIATTGTLRTPMA